MRGNQSNMEQKKIIERTEDEIKIRQKTNFKRNVLNNFALTACTDLHLC